MKSSRKKNLSGNKTTRNENYKIGKSKSHLILPTKKRQFTEKKQTTSIKKTQSKQHVQHISCIQQRISNIKKGFQQLQRKIINNEVAQSFTQPDILNIISSGTKQPKTKRKSHSKSPNKNKKCHNCIYSKAVYNLINIINYQKNEIERLNQELYK